MKQPRISINPKNRGTFTASAKKAGQGVQEHATSVLANPKSTTLQRKRANFAKVASRHGVRNNVYCN